MSRQGDVCGACFKDLRFITAPMCVCCGHPFAFKVEGASLCGECQREMPPFTTARSALIYNDVSRGMLNPFKNDHTLGAKRFASWCRLALGDELDGADFIIPVPLHAKRLRARGYNQAALLAKALSKQSGVPLMLDGLERTRATPKQQELSRSARQKNVRGAFHVRPENLPLIAGKHVVLVDDVMTTGATMDACAKAVKKARAQNITAVTVARVVQNDNDLI